MNSVNLLKVSAKAKRLGRTTDGLPYGWLNPFGRFTYKTPARANTYHAAERGEGPGIDSNNDATAAHLHHTQTAPDILQSVNDGTRASGEPATQGDEPYDSQATTAGSPTTTQDEQGAQMLRKRATGAPLESSRSKETSAPEDEEKPKVKTDFTFKNQIQRTLLSSPINILLLAAPAGIVLWALKIPGPAVFIVNFIAIIPLATLLSDATEQVALRTGETIGGLINATFG